MQAPRYISSSNISPDPAHEGLPIAPGCVRGAGDGRHRAAAGRAPGCPSSGRRARIGVSVYLRAAESAAVPQCIAIAGPVTPQVGEILTPEALAFVAQLQRAFEPRRAALLARRAERYAAIAAGSEPTFRPDTAHIRQGAWRVAPAPHDLQNRRVEITGPAERKMVINALNSGAQVFMADFEDANAPTWQNMAEGQVNLRDAVRRTIRFTSPDGADYRLRQHTAVLAVRPRGWHLPEKHAQLDGQPVCASLFDFGLFLFHNARELLDRGTGPYFYLPKLQSYEEAHLWNDVFDFAEEVLRLPRGCIKATVLIEHVLAAFEMDEMLYALREHSVGLNLGRWDYIFSFIKTFSHHPDKLLPDRALLTVPATPFLRAASRLLVHTCHRRGAHAMGGMSAFIPRRDDPAVNEQALAKVRADKSWEAAEGYDGAWVAHPGLVPIVQEVFDQVLGERPHQVEKVPALAGSEAGELLEILRGPITEEGLRTNLSVALEYLAAWLGGRGAVAVRGLMEDVATAEISRSQVWQWVRHGAATAEGRPVTLDWVHTVLAEERQTLERSKGEGVVRYPEAAELLARLVGSRAFVEFLTLPGYDYLR
ncbi:MAG: malate synthase A [Chloroflexi bacterium]|nr:malate synthase A [Chloroflexota bacterium]